MSRPQAQPFIEMETSRRPAFRCIGRHASIWRPNIVGLAPRAALGPCRPYILPKELFGKRSGRHYRQKRLSATTTAQQSRSQFTYSTDQLLAMAEDMLDGKKQSVSAQELLEGLATSEARGLSDSSDQASERRRRFGVNKLPSRKEVEPCLHNKALCRGHKFSQAAQEMFLKGHLAFKSEIDRKYCPSRRKRLAKG